METILFAYTLKRTKSKVFSEKNKNNKKKI